MQIPGLTNAWVWPIKTRIDMQSTGIKTPVGIKVAGGDLKIIQKIGEEIEQLLLEVPGTASAFSERVSGGRYVTIDIDRVAASRYALNIDDIQDGLICLFVVRVAVPCQWRYRERWLAYTSNHLRSGLA